MNLSAIKAIGEGVAGEITSFRKAAVTSENRATPLARSILAALVAGSATTSLVESMVIHAFGNPKTPKGKAITGLTGSGDYLPGWGATRKTVASIFDIFANIGADDPVEQDEGEPIGAGECRRLVVAFILNDNTAPKSLRALREAVKAAIAAHAALLSPDNGEAEAEAAEAAAAEAGGDVPLSLTDRVNALTVAYGAATPEERVAAHEALEALFAAVNADVNALTAPEPELVA